MTSSHQAPRLPRLGTLALCSALALSLGATGCDKEKATTPPTDPSATETDDTPAEAASEAIPQEPDPPELAQAQRDYELGNYNEVKTAMEALIPGLEGQSRLRANIMAHSWFAMAEAQEFPENARDHVESAMARHAKLGDPAVEQVARLANGAYYLGLADFDHAEAELAAAEALEGPATSLALLLHGQALLNQAFDENDRVVEPAKFDQAAASYQKVLASSEDPVIKGRAQAGLAALAKYQGKKEEICAQAQAAAESYEAGGASDFLKEVPVLLRRDAKCP